MTFTIPIGVKWIKVNSGQNGYYRVLYDEDNWGYIVEELKSNHETFSPMVKNIFGALSSLMLNSSNQYLQKIFLIFQIQDRIGLISDAFTLCHANLMPCQITMNLITYLPKEQNWGPMTTGLRHLEKWRRILKYSECFLMLTEVVKQILSKPVNVMGWNNVGKDEVKYAKPMLIQLKINSNF